jgi:hypothetical protein
MYGRPLKNRAKRINEYNVPVSFFKKCQSLLETTGHADEAFYFEQIVDHLKNGNILPTEEREISRMLGL